MSTAEAAAIVAALGASGARALMADRVRVLLDHVCSSVNGARGATGLRP